MSPFWRGFLRGVGLLWLADANAPRPLISAEEARRADAAALASDWAAVGGDLRKALDANEKGPGGEPPRP